MDVRALFRIVGEEGPALRRVEEAMEWLLSPKAEGLGQQLLHEAHALHGKPLTIAVSKAASNGYLNALGEHTIHINPHHVEQIALSAADGAAHLMSVERCLGHEMTHALEEHAKSKIGAQALTNLAIGIGTSYAGANIGEAGNAAINLGSQIGIGLPYSRNLESRADYGGLMLMAQAGYNPNAAITLWEKMNRLDGKSGSAFLSTHPSNTQRIADMRKNLPAAMAIYNNSRR